MRCNVVKKNDLLLLLYRRKRVFYDYRFQIRAISDSTSSQRVRRGQERHSTGGNRRRERLLPPLIWRFR